MLSKKFRTAEPCIVPLLALSSVGFADARGPPEKRAPQNISKKYAFSGKILGSGTYATVHEARNRNTGARVAIKETAFDNLKNGLHGSSSGSGSGESDGSCEEFADFPPEDFHREMGALTKLQHGGGVISVHESFVDTFSRRCWIVMDRMDCTLHDWFRQTGPAQRKRLAWSVCEQLARAVCAVHAAGISHRDLKPQNVLMSANGLLKLADFGISRCMPLHVETLATPRVVTLPYRAPELLIMHLRAGKKYARGAYNGPAVDVWSLACLFYQVHVGATTPLFSNRSDRESLLSQISLLGLPPSLFFPSACAAHCRCFVCRLRTRDAPDPAVSVADFAVRHEGVLEHGRKEGGALVETLFEGLCLDPKLRASAAQLHGVALRERGNE